MGMLSTAWRLAFQAGREWSEDCMASKRSNHANIMWFCAMLSWNIYIVGLFCLAVMTRWNIFVPQRMQG